MDYDLFKSFYESRPLLFRILGTLHILKKNIILIIEGLMPF